MKSPVRDVINALMQVSLSLPYIGLTYLVGGKQLVLSAYVGILHNHRKWLLANPHLRNQTDKLAELEKEIKVADYSLRVIRGGEEEKKEEPPMKN